MANPDVFSLKIMTPKGMVLEKNVFFLKLPTPAGEIGIVPGHTPSVFQLGMGELVLTYDEQDADAYFFIVRGYSHVSSEGVVVLTPFLEFLKDIDYKRAKESEERSLKRLRSEDDKVDRLRAQISLGRAQKRVHLVDYYRK